MKFVVVTLLCLASATPFALSQTYRGYPIIRLPDTRVRIDSIAREYGVDNIFDRRTNPLNFYQLLTNLAEPSTISPLANFSYRLTGWASG